MFIFFKDKKKNKKEIVKIQTFQKICLKPSPINVILYYNDSETSLSRLITGIISY